MLKTSAIYFFPFFPISGHLTDDHAFLNLRKGLSMKNYP